MEDTTILMKRQKIIDKERKNNGCEQIFTRIFRLYELEDALNQINLQKAPGNDLLFEHFLTHLQS